MFLATEEIDYVESEGNYARLHVGRESYLLRQTISSLELQVNPARFARIHRSTIVNLSRVKELHLISRGDFTVLLRDGRELLSTKSYRDRLKV